MGEKAKALFTPAKDAHVGACGLFCSNRGKFKKGKCPGCQISPGFAARGTRSCCQGKGIVGCWECGEFKAPRDFAECGKINNFIAKVFALIFKSDRPAALRLLRDQGMENFLGTKRSSGKM